MNYKTCSWCIVDDDMFNPNENQKRCDQITIPRTIFERMMQQHKHKTDDAVLKEKLTNAEISICGSLAGVHAGKGKIEVSDVVDIVIKYLRWYEK